MLKISIPNNFISEKKYIINTFFTNFLGLNIQINNSTEKNYVLLLENGNKIIFFDDFFHKITEQSGYLSEKNIPTQINFTKNKFIVEKNIPIIFGNEKIEINKNEIYLGIDIFASSFFMLTRWEEYVIKQKDKHKRFPDEISLSQKNNFEHRPIVNEYVEMLWNMLKFLGCKQKRKKHKYQAIITHDIDFLKRYDKFSKLIKAIGGDIILRKNPFLIPKTIKNYIHIKKGKIKDIYDTFDYLMDISEKYNLKSRFYFIPGMLGEEDVRYNITNNFVAETINKIKNRNHNVGIHGTYKSYNKLNDFKNELDRLKKIQNKITEGRQHYLRFENPTTWQIWEDNNLKIDSTIGFSNTGGFRAGTCYEYPVFNILTRKTLNLIERPLIAMEVAIKTAYPKPNNFYNKIIELSEIVKKYNGNFVFLWHNNNFYTHEWKLYSENYDELIKNIS